MRGSLDGLEGLDPNVAYEKNHLFDISRPYQFTRVELDPTTGAPLMKARNGLCCVALDTCSPPQNSALKTEWRGKSTATQAINRGFMRTKGTRQTSQLNGVSIRIIDWFYVSD